MDKKTGQVVWKSKPGIGGYATPRIFFHRGRKHFVLFGERNVFTVEVKTGKPTASYPWTTRYDVNATDPVVVDSQIFISSAYDTGCALFELRENKLDLIWKNKNMTSHFSSVLYHRNRFYGIQNPGERTFGNIVCLDPKTGRQLWLVKGLSKKYCSFIIADGKFIIQSENGSLTIAEEKNKTLQDLSTNSLPRGIYWTPPVLCRGSIYARDSKKGVIYAVSVEE